MSYLERVLKVKACPKCWLGYTVPRWNQLALVSVDPSDGAETRRCRCGTEMVGDVAHWAELDLRDDEDKIADALCEMRRIMRRRLLGRLASVVAVAILVAVLGWLALAPL